MRYFVFLFLTIAAISCNFVETKSDVSIETVTPESRLEKLVFGSIDSAENLLKEDNLGKQTLIQVEPNPHIEDGPDLEFHTIHEGKDSFSVIWMHENRSTVKLLVTTARLKSGSFIDGEIRPGIPEAELIQKLGEPISRREHILYYELQTGFLPVEIEFHFDAARKLEEILIQYPYD